MLRDPSALVWMVPALLAALAFAALARRRRRLVTEAVGEAGTLARLLPSETAARRRLRAALRLAGLCLVFVALAGPQWGVELVSSESKAGTVIIAVDVSASMSAEDVKPSRLAKAKGELALLLDGLKASSRVGIIAFAGEAALVCPITTDLEAARQVLAELEVGFIPQPGSAIGKALRLAAETLKPYPGGKAVVLLTDGEDSRTDPAGAADEAAAAGARVFAIGIGSPAGEPIPVRDPSGAITGYKQDKRGQTVMSRLGEEALEDAARRAGGSYFRASPGEEEAAVVARILSGLEKAGGGPSASVRYRNRYQFPLALAFLLLLAELAVPERRQRRGRAAPAQAGRSAAAAALLLLALAGPAPEAGAATAEGDLRQGNRYYGQGRYLEALQRYARAARRSPRDSRPPFNAGDALYRLGQLEEAETAFRALSAPGGDPGLRAGAYYNLGNVLLERERFDEAVKAYQEALALASEDQDIRHNLALALRRRREPPPPKKDDPRQKPAPPQDPKKDPSQDDRKDQEKPGAGKPPEARSRPQDQLTKEDAERILRAQEQKEKESRQLIHQNPAGRPKPPEVEEDW